VGAVGGADLDELGAALGHYLGNPEASADLDELAARDQNLFPLSDRVERQDHCRSAVVDDECVLRAGQLFQQSYTV